MNKTNEPTKTTKPNETQIIELLDAKRIERKYSLKELANRTGMPLKRIYAIFKTGKTGRIKNLAANHFVALCVVLGVTLDEVKPLFR